MAEIQQPAPIKPVWPSKPGSERERRRRPEPLEQQEKTPQQEQEDGSSDQRPKIDEYV